MNPIAEEIMAYYGISELSEQVDIVHYGMPRRSGRYPWGSGKEPFQHHEDFLGRIKELKDSNFEYTDDEGKTWTGDAAIYKSMGLTSSEYRRQVSWAGYERRLLQVERAKSLREDGLGATEIGRRMGINESTVRSLLNPDSEVRMHKAMETVNLLRSEVDSKKMIDVGINVDKELGISKERLDLALDYLQRVEGYEVWGGGMDQPTNPGQRTNQRVLCVPGTKNSDIYKLENVKTITEYTSPDMGETFHKKFTYPASLDSRRLKVLLADDVGPDGELSANKDGIIELRRGVPDLSLGDARYSQVRILVDGTHYLKGMAVYSDNMPDGVDVIYNTSKHSMDKALKPIKLDPDNPFGSAIKDADKGGQYWYKDPKTGEEKLGLINKRADEGDWDEWANAVPSQFLAKQSFSLAEKQLKLAKADKYAEFDEYCSIVNPTIKKHMLEKFADNCDSAAVHLKAAALPGQKYHVIVPMNTLKDNEVFAPGYKDGTKLALVRYPHEGRFQIPILTVNNKNELGKRLIGLDSIDAVGINQKNAERLSGADFDGDTVMCIPTHDKYGNVKILNEDKLKGLEGFDNKALYGAHEERLDSNGKVHYYRNGKEYPIMKNTGVQMGMISNLITDMTLAGATPDELARATRHSMTVIDAEKHKLDYKQSEIDNNITALKQKYQVGIDKNGKEKYGGASTILSRAKGETQVEKRQGGYKVNMPDSKDYDPTRPIGAKLWKTADDLYYVRKTTNKKTGLTEIRTEDGKKISFDITNKEERDKYYPIKRENPDGSVYFTNKDGTLRYRASTHIQESTRMAETDDAYSLVSTKRHPMELLYAGYANDMKALANQARVEMKTSGKIAYSAKAKATYAAEVKSLQDKLDNALLNSPRERHATRLANIEIQAKKAAYKEANGTDMKPSDVKKISQQAMTKYRQEVGAIKRRDRNIEITDREWEAIQAGAITESKLIQILNNTDIDKLRERATPKSYNSLSSAQINRAKALASSNYTIGEIAQKLGVSTSTVSKYLKGVK